IPAADGSGLAGVLMLDMRTGEPLLVRARSTLLATGGGPTMYKYHTPSGDKSCDGMAMALRAGLPLRDIEMVQFHPTGLLAGPGTRMTGTVLEEGLRGAGGYLTDSTGERFMFKYDPRGERATRDIVSRSIQDRIRAGFASPHGGVYIEMAHLGPDSVRRAFKGMVERCTDCGFDLAAGRVEVVPTAHYMMGGVRFRTDCTTEFPGLYAAGEDTGGVHGANRLGGNGVANSTVFGGIAGDTIARSLSGGSWSEPDDDAVNASVERALRAVASTDASAASDLESLRDRLYATMWDHAGIVRDAAGLARAASALGEIADALDRYRLPEAARERAFNMTWHDWLNLTNLVAVSRVIVRAAQARENSRGAHFRSDFPEPGDLDTSTFTRVRAADDGLAVEALPVRFTRVRPGQSLI
ncbi:MAG TPA: FAD-binding protein, partial [Gemmatimonadaceae bacterium]|nr:FAD-binding protein [Gemmatimonadaceae bacterium]